MWGMELEISAWGLFLFVYLLFGLAPTMTFLTSVVVGFLYGRADLGWGWGLGIALVSSPVGLITFTSTAPGLRDRDPDSWTTWLNWVVPYVVTGLVFSCIAATMIEKGAGKRK